VTTIILLQLFSLGVMAFFIGIVAFMVARVRANTSRQRSWVVLEETTLPGDAPKDRT
jgi:dolichol-phosphate mannosyltransferase